LPSKSPFKLIYEGFDKSVEKICLSTTNSFPYEVGQEITEKAISLLLKRNVPCKKSELKNFIFNVRKSDLIVRYNMEAGKFFKKISKNKELNQEFLNFDYNKINEELLRIYGVLF